MRACVRQEQELVFEDERRVATNRFCVRWGLPLATVPPVQAFLLPPVKVYAKPVPPAVDQREQCAFDSPVQLVIRVNGHARGGRQGYAPASLSFAGCS